MCQNDTTLTHNQKKYLLSDKFIMRAATAMSYSTEVVLTLLKYLMYCKGIFVCFFVLLFYLISCFFLQCNTIQFNELNGCNSLKNRWDRHTCTTLLHLLFF